jgi:hypothetical protein
MRIVLLIWSVMLASGFVLGQDRSLDCASCKCPNTKIEASSSQASEEDIVAFEVIVVDSKLRKCELAYEWHASAGEIVSGQSTKIIRLKVPKGSAGTTISVVASINGDRACENNPSETIAIKPK